MNATPALRIGDVARLSGVRAATLHKWQARYGLLDPARTPGGHRLYSHDDVERVRAVVALVRAGWAVSAAAGATAGATQERGHVGVDADTLEEFLAALHRRDARGATAVVDRLLAADASPEMVLLDLLVPAQLEVGSRWQADRWSVADEHACTAIVDRLLARLTLTFDPVIGAGEVVVVCAEDDWHVLPARMFAELLRLHGWSVTFLGGSVPAEHLARFLADNRPVAVALSCTVPLFLPGAVRSIAAAHDVGVPVLAGGRAFGHSSRRAVTVGADAWAGDASSAAGVFTEWLRAAPQLAQPDVDLGTWQQLELVRPSLVSESLRRLSETVPASTAFDARQACTREDFNSIVEFVGVSVLVRDPDLLMEFLAWLDEVLQARGLPPSVLVDSLRLVTAVMADADVPAQAVALLSDAVADRTQACSR